MYGDNIYFKNEDDTWGQIDSAHSKHEGVNDVHLKTDTEGKYALIAEEFYYFGDSCPEIPDNLKNICKNGIGEKTIKNIETIEMFLVWLKKGYKPGLNGDPLNWMGHDQQSLF